MKRKIITSILVIISILAINKTIPPASADQIDQTNDGVLEECLFEGIYAQSFKPTLPILTRVELYCGGHYYCSIRWGSETQHGLTLIPIPMTSITEDYDNESG